MLQKHFIDSHKALTPVAVIIMIVYYQRWENPTGWAYLALHGTYGVLWMMKSRIFPDKQWEKRSSLAYGLLIWAGLSLYWIAPWLITSQNIMTPMWYMASCVTIYTIGIFFHFTSDMQKHTALSLRPGHLVTSGLWKYSRNPNYFGELLIYLGFSLLAMHWIPIAALGLFMTAVWIPNMIRKDRSLSRYPEFAAYKARTKWLIPFVI